ncbi:MAG: alpha-L-arabinofuranosidase C-terminal domain-containing protein [Fimbriimonas sp.]
MIVPLLVTITLSGAARPISPDLFGIFFEDLNYAADGGLYAELVQNRSFEYTSRDRREWHGLTAWTLVKEADGEGRANLRTGSGLHPNNPHYVSLFVEKGRVGLRNEGYGGMPLRKGEPYDFSVFACAFSGKPGPIAVRLEDKDGNVLASASLPAPAEDWKKLVATLTPRADAAEGRLVVLASGSGATGLDMVSLFPRKTFRGRTNGLRADLAQAIADLRPKFVRFPGGCIVHGGGHGLSGMYNWKKTVGPVETRRAQPNSWGYHQSAGIGYFEYFQFCEDIGAKPLPVVPAAVSCQNTDHNWGKGQEGLPMADMKAYIQDVLDLVEYANGPASSKWGRLRAAAGHPKPFNLEYLAIGNEEAITPVFETRFRMIHDAVKAKYPKLKLIGTTGPFAAGEDFENGWKFARAERLAYVDEHYYVPPVWFWDNLTRYDGYKRTEAKVYAGEYAAHEEKRENTLRSALAEAAYLTSLERNADVVTLSSYAPLLAKEGHTQWRPDLIYFDNHTVSPSVNYQVQKLFMHNAGDRYLPANVDAAGGVLASSVVQDSKSGDVIVKLVSRAESPIRARLDLSSVKGIRPEAVRTVLAGDPLAQNAFGQAPTVVPRTDTVPFVPGSEIEVPACSLTVLRLKTR